MSKVETKRSLRLGEGHISKAMYCPMTHVLLPSCMLDPPNSKPARIMPQPGAPSLRRPYMASTRLYEQQSLGLNSRPAHAVRLSCKAPLNSRPGTRSSLRVSAQQPGTAIERADTRKGTLAHTVQETIISPITAGVLGAGALAGAYLYGHGVEGATLGIFFLDCREF